MGVANSANGHDVDVRVRDSPLPMGVVLFRVGVVDEEVG